ncbi:DUF3493 domain-containing protein [Trichormus azollae]|uniref:DUF3493 domain-containing protein n=1 Tax=Trichormus azollae TaxID=1164 RepID=UPI00325DDBA0
MVELNPKNRLNSKQYAHLKREITVPYRGLRQFIYVSVGASSFIGAFVFSFQILAGRNIDTTLPNFALQAGIVGLMVFLYRWEKNSKNGLKG